MHLGFRSPNVSAPRLSRDTGLRQRPNLDIAELDQARTIRSTRLKTYRTIGIFIVVRIRDRFAVHFDNQMVAFGPDLEQAPLPDDLDPVGQTPR